MARLRHRSNVSHAKGSSLFSNEKEGRNVLTMHKDGRDYEDIIEQSSKAVRRWWSRRALWFRLGCIFVLMVTSSGFLIGIIDSLFHTYGSRVGKIKSKRTATFAVAINTYKRPERLHKAVEHYSVVCGKRFHVGQVFVLWAEQEAQPPDASSFGNPSRMRGRTRQDSFAEANRASVHVIALPKDSLNSRFLPIPDLEGNAVFMVDDDVRVDCVGLLRAFEAWQENQDSMVGYYPRLSSPPYRHHDQAEKQLVYYTWPKVFLAQRFNFVLTKACFLHKKYLDLYSSENHPQPIRDYVDSNKNCEDVAMSLLVANSTTESGEPPWPIYVEGNVWDTGLFGGISTGSGHFSQRSSCLNDLTNVYTEHGWGSPLSKSVALADHSWVHHSPGFWWQLRPSNFFEWFAFENFFI